MTITLKQAERVLKTVDAGLCRGLGSPIPGKMCVEAAVCYGLGLPHSDKPTCVAEAVRQTKIALNDSNWSSNAARAMGMRRLAIAQLGSDSIDRAQFLQSLSKKLVRYVVPIALRAAAAIHPEPAHVQAMLHAADTCADVGDNESALVAANAAYAARAANATAYAANATAYAANATACAAYDPEKLDEMLTLVAELAVDVLRELNCPGIALMDEICPLATKQSGLSSMRNRKETHA